MCGEGIGAGLSDKHAKAEGRGFSVVECRAVLFFNIHIIPAHVHQPHPGHISPN